MSKIDSDTTLEESFTTGVLTDVKGFEDIGTFKYYVKFDIENKNLYRIKNIENTEHSRTENYYFKKNKLVAITVKSSIAKNEIIYLNKGKIISSLNVNSKEEDLLLTKAKGFQKEYKKQ